MSPPRDESRLCALEREAELLASGMSLPLASALLSAEIARLRAADPASPSAAAAAAAHAAAAAQADAQAVAQEAPHGTRKRIRLRVPAERYPEYNFVGRLLGPRGATLKKLERETGCKIMIRGRGSIRKDKEADVRGKPGWEHVFNEHLHVVVEVADAADEEAALRALNRAKEHVELLLVPVPEEKDTLKRQQLRDLAILNGTYRSSEPPPAVGGSGATAAAAAAALAAATITPLPSLYHPNHHFPVHHLPPQQHLHPSFASSAPFAAAGGASYAPPRASASASAGATSPAAPLRSPSARTVGGIRIPSLDIEVMSESFLASPSAVGMNGIGPGPSPTIVDPEMYPFPPTPSLTGEPGTTYGSPIWSPLHSGGSAPPPMSAPLGQTGYFSQQQQGQHQGQSQHQQHHQHHQRAPGVPLSPRRVPVSPRAEMGEIGGLSPLRTAQNSGVGQGVPMGHAMFRLSSARGNGDGDPGRTEGDGDWDSPPRDAADALNAAALSRSLEETKFFEDDLPNSGL